MEAIEPQSRAASGKKEDVVMRDDDTFDLGKNWMAWAGWFLGLIGFLACVALSFLCAGAGHWTEGWSGVLLCVLGVVLGWTVGILVSPATTAEERQFSGWARAVGTFISGFGVAKLNQLSTWTLFKVADADVPLLRVRIALFLACFLIGALCTFCGRRYVNDGDESELLRQRENCIDGIEKKLEELRLLR